MENLNQIGLRKKDSEKISELLNGLLSDYQIHYQNLRGLHWLVKGERFFSLHELYEKLYDEAADTIDEIAERILMLGNTPLHKYQDYLNGSTIQPVENVTDGKKGLNIVIKEISILLGKARNILSEAANVKDEGTVALVSELIPGFEKHLWMLNACAAE